MATIYAKHEPYGDGHLSAVIAEMRLAGSPTIRCVEYRGSIYALDGSHRLAAAHFLRLPIKVVLLCPDADDALAAFWQRVAPDRPEYDCEATHLRLDAFIFEDPA